MSLRAKLDQTLKHFEKDFATHNHVEVSRSALLHNVEVFEKLSGQQIIPVIKGNAYGHGIKVVVKALRGKAFPYVAVDGYFEALRIREVSKQPVLIMGAILPENFARMKYNGFAFVVQNEPSIRALGSTKKHLKVHLECNTGFNRYGAEANELTTLTKLILSYKNLTLEGVMSHLADADGDDPQTVGTAVEAFDACVEIVRAAGARPPLIHVAQSMGSVVAVSKYANAVRVGIGLYGVNPFPRSHAHHDDLNDLRPAMCLVSTITQVRELNKGDQVSYNYTFTSPKHMKIGVLPLGYYEGVNRALSNAGVVKIGDEFAPIIGRVNMNHTIISLEGIEANVGDEVVVYSNDLRDPNAIVNIAHDHNLFVYSLLTGISPDVRKVLVD